MCDGKYIEHLVQLTPNELLRSHPQWFNIYSGVPQGLMIGPILFFIYINDLPTGIKSKINIFADDTKVVSKVDTVEDKIVNDDIEALQKW